MGVINTYSYLRWDANKEWPHTGGMGVLNSFAGFVLVG